MQPEAIWEQLSAKGYKTTRTRQKIVQVLAQESDWITANSLYVKLCGEQTRIELSTVCRNLDILSNMGVLCRVDRERNGVFAYRLREMEEHHHHLVCLTCGKITPLRFCPLKEMNPSQTLGYSELECHFEVYGCCQDCQSK